ncbi:uncharacterized protein PFL1_04709 [Pseudozyma flocculosa PF-1]|uniref:Uncharacterized protein n=2 Tax=Pseudozyma flocculosa TaxID=84751 RepID=A0A5C3F7N5_9BASI|nr:uncharacterized protein PFL1_04709 [Pseudozyma flocculosa PF-1]EPQ27571.1 hypothetical protein PFL1_04709 [Pseudozyma flocculosa PF-1]SPO39301.1 uncharacterized protein PSFLO_04781 [Pseudozyma flocculosa]
MKFSAATVSLLLAIAPMAVKCYPDLGVGETMLRQWNIGDPARKNARTAPFIGTAYIWSDLSGVDLIFSFESADNHDWQLFKFDKASNQWGSLWHACPSGSHLDESVKRGYNDLHVAFNELVGRPTGTNEKYWFGKYKIVVDGREHPM